MSKIIVQNTSITVLSLEEQDCISLTDMATAKEGDNRSADIIKNWLRNRYTIEFLGTWEVIHNPDFKVVEFDHFRMSAVLPSFVLSAFICELRRLFPRHYEIIRSFYFNLTNI